MEQMNNQQDRIGQAPEAAAQQNMSRQSMQVRIDAAIPCADPDPMLQYVFSMFAVMTWISTVHVMSDDVLFVSGILQICLGTAAFVGSLINLKRGDPHGNINLILSVILGFAAGLTQIASVVCKAYSIHFHPWIMSIILLTGGIYMLCFLPLLKKMPLYVFVSHLCVSLGFLCRAIADLASIPVLMNVGAWLLLIFALTAFYQGVSLMYAQYGIHIPQGVSLQTLTEKS